MHGQIERNVFGQLQPPNVPHVAESDRTGALLDHEIAAESAFALVTHLRLPFRHVVLELGFQQLFRATLHSEFAGAHVDGD